jgi:hypothetical protein
MKKQVSASILFLFIISFTSCKIQEEKKIGPVKTPESFTILAEIEGDLDKDGISEKVIVYDTNIAAEIGTERHIYIYKKKYDSWEVWDKSTGAILLELQGGMMGDPFKGISIDKNCIVINHFGGSRQKWSYMHRFKFQNGEFQLIGATTSVSSPCDYFSDFEYNLSNGKINYKKETEDCENENTAITKEELVIKVETVPTINGFSPGVNKIILPKSETTIYY